MARTWDAERDSPMDDRVNTQAGRMPALEQRSLLVAILNVKLRNTQEAVWKTSYAFCFRFVPN